MRTGPAEVDVALTAVVGPDGEVRLVLRRSVFALADDGREVSVEELWVAGPCASPFDVLETVRGVLSCCGPDLVRGREVGAPSGLQTPSTTQLVELQRATERGTVGVEYLVGYRGTVEDLWSGRPVLRDGDVVSTDGFLGARTRHLFVDVLRGLAVPGDARSGSGVAAPPAVRAVDEDVTRADLLRDLADARLRLDQELGWALLTATHLEYVAGAPAPRWGRAVRRTPDGATVESGDAPDADHDAVVVVFVRGRRGQVDLSRYRTDPGVDLPAVLGDPQVQGAFAACTADPGDSLAQVRAVAALRGAGAERDTTDGRAEQDGAVTGHVVPTTTSLDGVVVVHDCRWVAVGNDDRQFNTVAYVLAPAAPVDPATLRAIVDHSCRVDDPPANRLRKALATVVCPGG